MSVRGVFVEILVLGAVALAQPTPNDKPLSMKYDGARREGPIGVKPVVIFDDATQARGGAASGGSSEAVVYENIVDSGFGWFMKSDDVFGYGTWGMQMVFGNGFAPGDSVSSYMMRFFHSTSDEESFGDATVMTELWTGDPMSIMETVCAFGGVSAPIPGTQAIFSGLDYGTVFDLTAVLSEKVTIDCDRVWAVMTFVEGCRGAPRQIGICDLGCYQNIGTSNGVWLLWACEQFGGCPTATGYNSGTCCAFGPGDPNETCDHANVDGGGNLLDPCATTAAAHVTFCGDGAADYFVASINEPGQFRSFVSSVSAASDTYVSIVPVSVDVPPPNGVSSPGVISLGGDELVLQDGDRNVWLEFRIGDWDPNDTGTQLPAWQIRLDASSLSSGDQGVLTAYTAGGAGTCSGDQDCAGLLGPGGDCDPPGYYKTEQFGSGYCSYLFVDRTRDDYVHLPCLCSPPIIVLDVTTIHVRAAGTVIIRGPDDPEPFPAKGLYAATLTLHVPSDAKGTFTIEPFPFPESQLVNQDSQFIPLLGTKPAKITVQTGRCCFSLEQSTTGGAACLDELQTVASCAQMPGLTVFDPLASCDDPCPPICGDGFTDPGEECDDALAGNSDSEPDACRTDCTLPSCGDGIIDTDEACDSGSLNSSTNADACRTDCVLPTCGDNVRDTGEECDGLSDALCSGACRESCTCGFCGDGINDTSLGEECDVDGSGCPTGRCFSDCTCDTNVPTVSQWGMVILSLLLLTGAKGYFRRRSTPMRDS